MKKGGDSNSQNNPRGRKNPRLERETEKKKKKKKGQKRLDLYEERERGRREI